MEASGRLAAFLVDDQAQSHKLEWVGPALASLKCCFAKSTCGKGFGKQHEQTNKQLNPRFQRLVALC